MILKRLHVVTDLVHVVSQETRFFQLFFLSFMFNSKLINALESATKAPRVINSAEDDFRPPALPTIGTMSVASKRVREIMEKQNMDTFDANIEKWQKEFNELDTLNEAPKTKKNRQLTVDLWAEFVKAKERLVELDPGDAFTMERVKALCAAFLPWRVCLLLLLFNESKCQNPL